MYRADVRVMLRPAILDVQGKTVENALHSLEYSQVGHVRIGKHITLEIDARSAAEAETIARDVAHKVLSNPIIEDFDLEISQLSGATQS